MARIHRKISVDYTNTIDLEFSVDQTVLFHG